MFKASKAGKKACVIGMGKSGIAAANLLARKNFRVLISDAQKAAPGRNRLHKKVEVETGKHSDKVFDCDFIVKSPGVLPASSVMQKAVKEKIPVYSEMEVALSYLPKGCKVIAITGTNGKTTTVSLLSEILKQHCRDRKNGKRVFTAGNIGVPLADSIGKIKSGDYIVLEVSSYQLEDSTYFKPNAGAVLNITPDHIEHHGSFEKYIAAKKKIFEWQDKNGVGVINSGDETVLEHFTGLKGRIYYFATTPKHKRRAQVFYDGDEMIFSSDERLKPPKLDGIHNIENAMAAALIALSLGVKVLSVQKAFDRFKGVEHRIEKFLTHKGITCVDDSKSTNVDSTITALKALNGSKKIWLILGGQHKGFPYTPLMPYIEKGCKAVLTIGEAEEVIESDLSAFSNIIPCGAIEKAVKLAFKKGVKGDILLLSPACASFDQFKNFEERGRHFKHACRQAAKVV